MPEGLPQELPSDPTLLRLRIQDFQSEVTVIIVNYNGGGYLEKCLEALSKQTFENFSAVVVDNASTDESLSFSLELDERFFIVRLNRNVGFAAANNLVGLGISSLWMATLNPDAIPAVDWLEQLLKASKLHPDAIMFGSTQIREDDPSLIDGSGDVYSICGLMWRGHYNHPVTDLPEGGEVFGPCAAAALYRTDIFRSVRGFDERFFCYCEDVDLAFRMRLIGQRCRQVREALVYHAGSDSSGKHSDFSVYHGFRNRLWTYIKNMPFPLLHIFLLPHLGATCCHLIYEVIRGKGKSAWRGLADGVRGLGDVWEARRQIQRSRTASVRSISKATCWAPSKMLTRSHDVRSVERKD